MEFFAYYDTDGHDMMNSWDAMGGHNPWGWLLMMIVFVLVAAGIVWLVRSLGDKSPAGRAEDPMAILKTRYAKGEIDKSDYERIKKELQ